MEPRGDPDPGGGLELAETLAATPPGVSEAGVRDALVDARPDQEPAGLALARSRAARMIFGVAATAGLGRFRILERLGSGGMGVVYAAYDPTLDRGVALKLLRVPERGREAAIAEAKSLARLSHPNVVPVYDVGSEGDYVYIVMELVRGETLGEWVSGKDWRDIVGAYRQAGEALAAAHAAGLVHRDFKPANAIVGEDERVRVVDFGLACEAAEPSDAGGERQSVAGTPRYMAPEQAAGWRVTAAADQYSFCASLTEALTAAAADRDGRALALPRWLEAVLARGRAADPAQRFPTMRELLQALARDPARTRRRRLVVLAVAVMGAIAFVAGRATLIAPDEACRGGEAELAATWAPEQRAAALARIAHLGPYGSSLASRLAQQLGEYDRRWLAGHRSACMAHRLRAQTDTLLDRRTTCLERSRAALGALGDIVASSDAAALPAVGWAVRALPDPDACADLATLASNVAPPPPPLAPEVARIGSDIARVRIALAGGKLAVARDAVTALVARARALAYPPLLAEALLVQGQAIIATDQRRKAVPPLAEAIRVALTAGAEAIAVEAWARRAWAQGTSSDPGDALAGLDVIEALAESAPSAGFPRALLFNNVGSVELALGHRDRARAAFERGREDARGVSGPGAVELVNLHSNLALVTDDPTRRDALLAEAQAELSRLLGDDHPESLSLVQTRAAMTTRLAPARELLAPACEKLELHPALTGGAATCWAEVGYLARELHEEGRASLALERALRVGAADDLDTAEVVPYLTLWRGDAARAAEQFTAALARLGNRPDEPWWRRLRRAELELGLGRARRAAGALSLACEVLRHCVAELAPIAREHPAAAIDRRLGRARAELALALAASGGPPAEIRELASAAASWLRAAGGSDDEIAALERLPAPHR